MKKLLSVCDAGKPVQLPCGHAWFSCVPSVASRNGRSGSVKSYSSRPPFNAHTSREHKLFYFGRKKRLISITQGRAFSSERCDVVAGPKCRRSPAREYRILAYFF